MEQLVNTRVFTHTEIAGNAVCLVFFERVKQFERDQCISILLNEKISKLFQDLYYGYYYKKMFVVSSTPVSPHVIGMDARIFICQNKIIWETTYNECFDRCHLLSKFEGCEQCDFAFACVHDNHDLKPIYMDRGDNELLFDKEYVVLDFYKSIQLDRKVNAEHVRNSVHKRALYLEDFKEEFKPRNWVSEIEGFVYIPNTYVSRNWDLPYGTKMYLHSLESNCFDNLEEKKEFYSKRSKDAAATRSKKKTDCSRCCLAYTYTKQSPVCGGYKNAPQHCKRVWSTEELIKMTFLCAKNTLKKTKAKFSFNDLKVIAALCGIVFKYRFKECSRSMNTTLGGYRIDRIGYDEKFSIIINHAVKYPQGYSHRVRSMKELVDIFPVECLLEKDTRISDEMFALWLHMAGVVHLKPYVCMIPNGGIIEYTPKVNSVWVGHTSCNFSYYASGVEKTRNISDFRGLVNYVGYIPLFSTYASHIPTEDLELRNTFL